MSESSPIQTDDFPKVREYQVAAIVAAEKALIEKGELHHINWLETLRYELTHNELGGRISGS